MAKTPNDRECMALTRDLASCGNIPVSYYGAEHSSFVSGYRLSDTASSSKSGAPLGSERRAPGANACDGSKTDEPSEKSGMTLDFPRRRSPRLRASCKQ